MPTFKVKPETYDSCCSPASPADSKKHYPTVYVPASQEIIDALEVGQSAEVTLIGKVVGLSSNQSESGPSRTEVRLELRTVGAEPGDEAEEDDDDAEEKDAGTAKGGADAIKAGLGYKKAEK